MANPAPVLEKPLVPASGTVNWGARLRMFRTGWLAPFSSVSGPSPPKIQKLLAVVASWLTSVPMV
jgi:hypothetical protein